MRSLAVCWKKSKLGSISSQVLWRMYVLLLVLLAWVASSSDSTSGGAAVSTSLIFWRCMFRAAMHGERCSGTTLGTSGSMV